MARLVPYRLIQYLNRHPDFVEVKPSKFIEIDMRYASRNNFMDHNIYGRYNRCFLHKTAYRKLMRAAHKLDYLLPGHRLLLLDCLRPRRFQSVLYRYVIGTSQRDYIAHPNAGSMHNYGMAVDVTIVSNQGRELWLGTEFDNFSTLAEPQCENKMFEEGLLSLEPLIHRLILRRAMHEAGFSSLPNEWWHFDALPAKQIRSRYKIVQ